METHLKNQIKVKVFLFVALVFLLNSNLQASIFNYHERIDSIQLEYNANELRLPGESFSINLIVFQKNGKVKQTSNFLRNSVSWHHFNVEVIGGSFCLGRVYVNEKLLPAKGKYILIKVYPRKAPDKMKKLLLPLNFEEQIELVPTSQIIKAPGYGFHFKIVSFFDNGAIREYNTSFLNSGFDNYNLEPSGGAFRHNKFIIENDFRNITNHTVSILAISKRNPECTFSYDLQLDYKANYYLNYSGSSGFSGFSGSSGSNGSSGSQGGDGGNGACGGDGSNGSDVGVWVDMYFDSILGYPLLYVYAENLWTGRESYYLVNPNGGRFYVNSDGGNGGSGGSGGSGGDGGKGSDGAWHSKEVALTDSTTKIIRWQDPGENGGNGGYGGCGGNGGYGGHGGDVFIYLTHDAQFFSNLIKVDNDGGWGGSGGFAGSGGKGGSGGSGDPNGSSGSNGSSGHSGMSGAHGSRGYVSHQIIDDFLEYEPLVYLK